MISPNEFTFAPLSPSDVRSITLWRYPDEYSVYDTADEFSSLSYMLNPLNGFFGVYHARALIGFCSIGRDGQVPGGIYDETAVDIGAGMRPDLVGKGNGTVFLRAVVNFVHSSRSETVLRASIASWNRRALRAAARVGFVPQSTFVNTAGKQFTILTRLP